MSLERVVVYTPWPATTISEAISEFNDQMHDGAGVEEIRAGLHGLDFLTRRSHISDDLQVRLDGCLVEAHMRIELLLQKEAEQRSEEETRQRLVVAFRQMGKQAENILKRAREGFGSPTPLWRFPQEEEDE